jgi:membrane-bound inhibitor of C-type lysozyme
MRAGPAGSGVRYVTFGDGAGYVWHVKGPLGALFRTAPDADQIPLLNDCAAVPR